MILARTAASAAGLLSLASRQESSSDDTSEVWRVPDAKQSDFDQWYVIGEHVDLMWTGGYNDSFSDLWITGFDDSSGFAQLITRDVDLTESAVFTWNVSIPLAEIDALSSQFRFHFKPNIDNNYDPSTDDLPSPGFLITQDASSSGGGSGSGDSGGGSTAYLPNGMSTSTDGSCGGTVSCQGFAYGDCCNAAGYCGGSSDYCGSGCQSAFGRCSSTNATGTAANSGIATGQVSPGLPVGAQAGIGVGVVGAVIAVAGLSFFLVTRHKKRQSRRPSLVLQTKFGPGPGGAAAGGAMASMMEMTPVHKADINSAVTLTANESYYNAKPYEVDGGDDAHKFHYGQSAPVELDGGQAPAPVRVQELI